MKIKPCKNNIGAEIDINLISMSQKEIDEITVIDEGTYPIVERKFKKLEKGEKRSFRVAGPFRVFCEDLLNVKFEVNGEEVARVKEEGEGNYRFDLVK